MHVGSTRMKRKPVDSCHSSHSSWWLYHQYQYHQQYQYHHIVVFVVIYYRHVVVVVVDFQISYIDPIRFVNSHTILVDIVVAFVVIWK